MKRVLGLRILVSAVMISVATAPAAMAAEHGSEKKAEAPKEKKPKAPKVSVCENKALSYAQRYLCAQQTSQAQTKPELKKAEQRYADIVREVERKQKEQMEHE